MSEDRAPLLHNFDVRTRYCVQCGAAEERVVSGYNFQCVSGENVVAISHQVRGLRFSKLLGENW